MITPLNLAVSVIFVAVFLAKSSSSRTNEFPNIPCPEVFQYDRRGNKNIGLITIRNVNYGETRVSIELSQPGSTNSRDPGHLSLNFNKDKVFEYLSAGRPFTYRVDFPLQNIIPQVTSIRVNGVNICSGPANNSPSTTMSLEHTLNAFSTNSYSPQQSVPKKIATRPSSWPNFGQSSQVTSSSNTPGFLNFSPSYRQQMSMDPVPHQPTGLSQSSFNQSSFKSSPRNQPSNLPTSSHGQESFDQSPPYQPSYSSSQGYQQSNYQPSTFGQKSFDPAPPYQQSYPSSPGYQPSNYQPSTIGQEPFDSSPPYQPSYPSWTVNQPSNYQPPTFGQKSFDPSQPYQPSYPSSQGYQQSNYQPSTFGAKSFDQSQPYQQSYPSPSSYDNPSVNTPQQPSFLQYTFPSFDQSESDQSVLAQYNNNQPRNEKPLFGQQNAQFEMNPQNPFLKKGFGTNNNNAPGSVGSGNSSPQLELDARYNEPTDSPVLSTKPTAGAHSTMEYIDSVCGRENLNIDMKTLNVKGQNISKARFPWIVAVFKKNDEDLKFQCGGSLISTRTVVSAAHCFYLGFEAMRPEDIMISLGRHNLSDVLDAIDFNVERVIPHPDYRPRLDNFDADLAIVRLMQSVFFTTSVRPICMWQGNTAPSEIEGVPGAIVGWGSDGVRNTTTVPTLVNATIVSEITCLRSNDVFQSLTSNRTICAGNLDGSTPCTGDSGNGLMIRRRNKWMLRGTVSAALGSPTQPCGLNDYAIYSDIAMFIEWIRLNMLL